MSAASDANADIKRIDVTPRFADIVVHGGVLHTVEVPPTETGDIEAQTAGLLEALEKQLARGGSDKSRILCATIYLTDMADYAGMNKVRRQPASRAGPARLLRPPLPPRPVFSFLAADLGGVAAGWLRPEPCMRPRRGSGA